MALQDDEGHQLRRRHRLLPRALRTYAADQPRDMPPSHSRHTSTTHLQLVQARQGAWRPPGAQHAPCTADQAGDAAAPAANAEAASGLRRLAHHACGDARAAGTRRQSRLTLREREEGGRGGKRGLPTMPVVTPGPPARGGNPG